MKVLKTGIDNVDGGIIAEAVKVLAEGGVVLYPTDTVYGLGANIFDNKAVRRVFEIKKRNLLKPLSILVSDKMAIDVVAKTSNSQREIMDNYLPGPYTFILEKQKIVPRVITAGSSRVGVRVPDCSLACALARLFPITTTSANISDKEVLADPCEIIDQLDCEVDLVIDAGPVKSKRASVIVDLTRSNPKIVRR